VAVSRVSGHVDILADSLTNLGHEYLLQGDHQRATTLSEEALALHGKRGHTGVLQSLDHLGWAALARGDRKQAEALLKEGLLSCSKVGARRIAAEDLDGLACVAGAKADPERAARLFGAAQALHEAVGYHHTPSERAIREPYLADARSKLDEASWEAAFAEGQAMTFEEAVEYAVSEGEPNSFTTPSPERAPTAKPTGNLTPREWEVATLVARGLTNRQVARKLSISERTAGNHVAKILKKLGLRTRIQVASWATEARLPASPRPD